MTAQEPKQYGSESCHAYDREGNPRHSVPYKDKKRAGEMRPTTLRDIKENGWLPSVSAILGIMEKKGLDKWKKEQVAKAAYSVFQAEDYRGDQEAFVGAVLTHADAAMAKARDLGTEIHGAIERYLRGVQGSQEYPEVPYLPASELPYSAHTEAAVAALKELGVWGQPFEAEKTFSSPLGYGGTVDFMSDLMVADFKCVDRLDKKLTYDDRCSQLCAYFIGNSRFPKAMEKMIYQGQGKLANIFISTSEPGKYLIHEWSTEDKERGWLMFQQCLALWKTVNRYDPTL